MMKLKTRLMIMMTSKLKLLSSLPKSIFTMAKSILRASPMASAEPLAQMVAVFKKALWPMESSKAWSDTLPSGELKKAKSKLLYIKKD